MENGTRIPWPSLNAVIITAICLLCVVIFVMAGPPSDARKGKTEITYWTGWAGEELQVVEGFVEKFNRAHPDLHVKTTSIANSYQKMKVAFAGNDTPDACSTVWTYELVDYALRGALTPLDDYLARSGRCSSDYYDAVWKTYQYEGRTYALSQSMITMFIAYNKRLFREAGLDPEHTPATLDEFDRMAEQLTRYRNNDPKQELLCLGYAYGDAGSEITQWAVTFGVNFWDPETRRITVDSPEMVRCLEWMKRNVDKYGASRLRAFQSAFGNVTSPNNPFISGKVAMVQVGDWYRCIIEQYAPPDFDWGWFPIPAPEGGRPNSPFLMASMFVIPAASKHKDEAWQFIDWMTSEYVSRNMHVGTSPGNFPALRSASQYPEYQTDYWQFVKGQLMSPNATPPPKFPLVDRFASELSRMADFVVSGERTPEEALREMQTEFQSEIDAVYRTVEGTHGQTRTDTD